MFIWPFDHAVVGFLAKQYSCVSLNHGYSGLPVDCVSSNQTEGVEKLVNHLYYDKTENDNNKEVLVRAIKRLTTTSTDPIVKSSKWITDDDKIAECLRDKGFFLTTFQSLYESTTNIHFVTKNFEDLDLNS